LASIQKATGMKDILPEDRRYWDLIIHRANNLAERYGFLRVDIPIIEYTELFTRGVGTTSDFFVQKEMYTISEEDGTSITLRPEFTAGFVRAYLENGMASWTQPVKIYTIGPVFRRERPQAGRFRQHSQFNIEILNEIDPAADLEIMMLALNLHKELGYKSLIFQLNSTGCPKCKPGYIEVLREYLFKFNERLSAIDKQRLERNPLRVLDSKEHGMEEILTDAPKIVDYLCRECSDHFALLRQYLDLLNQPYNLNYRIVRGIDYYTKTVFELWDEAIGAQAALCGGGRYDGLAEAIGGPPTPGVGVGIGIDRIVIGLKRQGIILPEQPVLNVFVAHFGGETKEAALELAFLLRESGFGTRIAFAMDRRSMKSQMREANRHGVDFVFIIGSDELETGQVTVRRMNNGEQTSVKKEEIISWMEAG
jgi:histidyl-tRNA synthetase